ncbi:MAG: ATP phosphoribosyltransferase regulatory subunit [Bacillota bacterium]
MKKDLEKINFIDQKFSETTQSFGFKKIHPKILSDYNSLNTEHNSLLKLITPSGEIKLLQNDPTKSLLKRNTLFKKNYYMTTGFEPNKKMETLKGGIENLEKASIKSDVETIIIAYKFLKNLNIDKFILEIGHTHFIENLLRINKLTSKDRKKIYNAIHNKNSLTIEKILKDKNISNQKGKLLKKLPKLFGPYDKVLSSIKKYEIKEIKPIVKYLEKFRKILKIYNIDFEKIKIDLSLTNKYSYYDGFIFKAYVNDYGQRLLKGGRYIYNSQNGTGFGFEVKNLMEVIIMNRNLEDYTVLGTNESSVMIANQLRTKGYKVNQINQQLTSKAIKKIQTKYIIEVNDKKIKIIDQLKNTTQKQKINDFTKKIQTLTLKESIH